MNLRKIALLAAATVPLALPAAAVAFPISSVVVFGDSLSDNGNLYSKIGYPPAPYYQGRFSNGPVTVEQLAKALNAPLVDFAYGGATTGLGNAVDNGSQTTSGTLGLPGMQVEFAAAAPYLTPAVLANSLFVVWGGANDFFTSGAADVAAANIDSIVTKLETEGAQHILVPGLPDLGLTPEYAGDPLATLFSQVFNADLLAHLPPGATYVDTYNLLHGIVNSPASYGFKDVTDPCFNAAATPPTLCANPDQYLFFDQVHPTTAADAILASDFAAASGATPEPSSIYLITSGAAFISILTRKARRKSPTA